jgi:exopolysaccharide biosynthesis polyprenyl glycosylphosphotransferase
MPMRLSHNRSQLQRGAEFNIESRGPREGRFKQAAALGYGEFSSSALSGMTGGGDHGQGPFLDLGERGLIEGIKPHLQKVEASGAIGGDGFQHHDPGGVMDGSHCKRAPRSEKVLKAKQLTVFGCHSRGIPVGNLKTMNRKQEISKDLPMIFDGVILCLCLWGCYQVRVWEVIQLGQLGTIPEFSQHYWMLGLIIPLGPLLLDLQGYYEYPLSQRIESLLLKIGKAGFWVIITISIFSIFGRLQVPSRSVLILFIVLAPLLLLLRLLITRMVLTKAYKKGGIGERSVLVGLPADADQFVKGITSSETLELQITQRYDPRQVEGIQIIRGIRQHAAGRVIFVSPDSVANRDLAVTCASEGLDVWIVMHSIDGIQGTPTFDSIGKNRVMVFRKSPLDFWQLLIKRTLDFCGAALGLIILSPLCLAIAIIIKLTSPGPVIFSQVRSGKRGKRFTILKFRSMVANAPELHGDLSYQNEMEGPVFKITHDPRVTPFGNFLRRTSLDEIPQLVNVLRGEMSIVGPRPLPDYETEKIEKSTHRRRLSVKPGLTCLWQIQGRNSIKSFDKWVQLDIEYIDNASLLLDLWIILRTIPVVLFRYGAR